MTQQHAPITRRDQLTISGVVFREFKAKLEGMDFPVENGQPKSKLQFVGVEIIRTLQAYPHPALEITMNRANQKGEVSDRSPWGRLIISSDEQGYPDITELMGKTLHMNGTEQIIPADPAKGRDAGMFVTWEILSVDGVDKRTPPEEVAEPAPLAQTG